MNIVQGVTLEVSSLTFDAVDICFEEELYRFTNDQGSELIIRLDELAKAESRFDEFWSLIEDDETLEPGAIEKIKTGNFTFLMLSDSK